MDRDKVGIVIDGKYEILKQIGEGGMSKVYLAMDQRLNKQWAIKEITKQGKDKNNDIIVQSLITEANLMKKLDHPSLPRIVDIIDDTKTIYVIMDYIEGEPLSNILDMYGTQPQDEVIDWAKQLCDSLYYLHTRTPAIIYRDMKPANIMLQPDGQIKLIDFGIAREYKMQNVADTVSLGTKGYAAPEQFGGKGQTDARTDIYCLGVTLYHLLTGKNPCEPPYELYPIRHWNPNLSGGLEKIISKCTQLNPNDRYQSCAELLYALEHYDEEDDAYKAKQKSKVTTFFVTAGLMVIFTGIGIFGLTMHTQAKNADYAGVMEQAQKSANDTDAETAYVNAIQIRPTDFKAYEDLIARYKTDASFSVDEEAQLEAAINPNLEALKQQPGYADFAYDVGKLYWYYYDYGTANSSDNSVTRMKSAIGWFDDVMNYGDSASEHYQLANVYTNIGKFNRDITLNIGEASDQGTYKPYWKNIQSLLDLVDNNPSESEIVKLDVYQLAMQSMETYSRKFQAEGVTLDDINNIYTRVKNDTNGMATTADKTAGIKTNIQNRFSQVRQSIDNAYKVQGGN